MLEHRRRYCGLLLTALATTLLASCSPNPERRAGGTSSTITVLPVSQTTWTPLNPARGDASPRAATLWGNRGESVPTGFLVRFADGFSSPPHIHNVSYRGVVISGTVHNDDPAAGPMFMPAGSYWTQPAGQNHITAAKGSKNLAYIEIDDGPYLVLPVGEAFDNGEVPINVDASNLVWTDFSAKSSVADVEVAYLWQKQGKLDERGFFLRFPSGFKGFIEPKGTSFRAVVTKGRLQHGGAGRYPGESLDPGSAFASIGASSHSVACSSREECVLYIRTDGALGIR